RIAAGSVAAAAGFICLAYGVYGWAAFFLVLGALVIAVGCWELAIARSCSSWRVARAAVIRWSRGTWAGRLSGFGMLLVCGLSVSMIFVIRQQRW
ncbi:MAG TPA: hypothetical protein VIK57_20920, partial [Streptosporangiaceae bacterium]